LEKPSNGGWKRDLTADGDVEANPGPGVATNASGAASSLKIKQELLPLITGNEVSLGGVTVVPTQLPPMTHLGDTSNNVFALSIMY
jgi:hypothetical protein